MQGGYLCLFLAEVATVLINEVVDFASARNNRFFSTFTGGSRVLVEGLLSPREVRIGIAVALAAFLAASGLLVSFTPASASSVVVPGIPDMEADNAAGLWTTLGGHRAAAPPLRFFNARTPRR